ncbi:MAG: tRNA preQ1(34) S-adenosylmethionine ribosyltransferase-isomerase QueA [Xanthomonadales bacterium]|nr:tRNA preQ1(34) S-adenosylmethionine ribosyltransferase-isomerase QueA [Gammaproteobacteria bacterium]MBT8055341.1 tRNA preQ1(34) S-adenosylmethionine ribosyltransferase-isomerase QueA [Gammaproteobacteria bacterium]NNJ78181.1 tRNA preQ1(34) S-adenosylmethionine ribosyltransferase-isomerase QueA [Xanthomonadales bacterium]NNL04724.1 tRNA preQ1(34) S-adenosylmethionine ribosyltransferase-isomerase QueA [Xanthomonadales bacterium]
MKRTDFHFDLPPELVAQEPLARRSDSRLLQLHRHSGPPVDRSFRDLPDLLERGDLLVFNNTRVIPARLFGRKETGGRVEVMIERLLSDDQCLAQLRVSKPVQLGRRILLEDGHFLELIGREGSFFRLRFPEGGLSALLEAHGHMPLPPYIGRQDTEEDRERYQTVYASSPGAVAAPTAGLHFDEDTLGRLAARGIERTEVTLHVGAGTFQPVRCENIEEHRMHAEYLEVPGSVCKAVGETKDRGGRVIAVGTTAVRSLETAAAQGELAPFTGDSRMFIFPGYEFRVIDGLLTNFHLPESTLLMLVAALAGRERVLDAYRHAVEQRYRFFSYGDAMLLL